MKNQSTYKIFHVGIITRRNTEKVCITVSIQSWLSVLTFNIAYLYQYRISGNFNFLIPIVLSLSNSRPEPVSTDEYKSGEFVKDGYIVATFQTNETYSIEIASWHGSAHSDSVTKKLKNCSLTSDQKLCLKMNKTNHQRFIVAYFSI